ncbi:UbiA family prenyltransferase [Humidesulfovibrio sp.]
MTHAPRQPEPRPTKGIEGMTGGLPNGMTGSMAQGASSRLADLAALFRPRIGLMAAAGTGAGFLVASQTVSQAASLAGSTNLSAMAALANGNALPGPSSWHALAALAGAFLLACGTSALNQVQERQQDARMARTQNRPLPSGRMRPTTGLALALACLALSSLFFVLPSLATLFVSSPSTARPSLAALGLAAMALPGAGAISIAPIGAGFITAAFVPLTVLVYNGLYTPLKQRTSLAMLAGGLAGAFPPMIGFAAAGASPLSAHALLLAGVFYAWQVPHFWLFARLHQHEYEAAGFHVPQHGVAPARAGAALALWLGSYGALMLLAPAFGLVAQPLWQALVAALALALGLGAWPLIMHARLGFILVNVSLPLFLCLLAADALRLAA